MSERGQNVVRRGYVLGSEGAGGISNQEGRGVPYRFGGVNFEAKGLAPWIPNVAFEVIVNLRGGRAMVSKKCLSPVLVILEGNEKVGHAESLHLLTERPYRRDPRRKSVLVVNPKYIASFRVQVLQNTPEDLDDRIEAGIGALNGMNMLFLEFTFTLRDDNKWVLTKIIRGGY